MTGLRFAFSRADDFHSLKAELTKLGIDSGYRFVRKGSKKKEYRYFEYPPIDFQCKYLLLCWEELLRIQKESGEDINKAISYQRELQFLDEHEDDDLESSALDVGRSSFGNKPNLKISLECPDNFTFQEDEERKSFPLSVDFKFEYNSFRKKIIRVCEQTTGKRTGRVTNRDIIFVQTDIKNFFHTLEIEPLAKFFEKEYPWATNLISGLREANHAHGFTTLPIGWILSRFISNVVIQHFHHQFKGILEKNLRSSLESNLDFSANQKLQAPKKFDLKLEDVISFVDDFVFLISLPSEERALDPIAVAKPLIEEAQNLINKVIPENKQIEFYRENEPKTRIYRLDVDSITVLKANFAFFKSADEYFLDDPDIRARIDEVLLPSDNDLTFNQNEQFRRNLINLQKFVISERELNEKEIEDLLSQIKLKVEKTGAKYIRSVFGLLRLIVISDPNGKISKQIREKHIVELFRKCKKTHSFSADWLKFFSGYFNLLRATDYLESDRIQFFKLLLEAISLMRGRCFDDVNILQLFRNDCVFRLLIDSGLTSQRSRAAKTTDRAEASTLNELLRQRYLMIQFLAHLMNASVNESFDFQGRSSLWIGGIAHQLMVHKRDLKMNVLLTHLKSVGSRAENLELLDFGVSRFLSSLLPILPDSQIEELLPELQKLAPQSNELKYLVGLAKKRKTLANYFKMNESERRERALQQLFSGENNDYVFDALSALQQHGLRSIELLAAYFISLRLNDENDFYRYVSKLCHHPEMNQVAPWSGLPITFQRVGISISAALKTVFDVSSRISEEKISVELMPLLQNQLLEDDGLGKSQKSIKNKEGKLRSPTYINLDRLASLFGNSEKKWRPFKVTVAPLSMDQRKDLAFDKGFQYTPKARRRIDIKIRNAIDEAIRQESSFLVFPELSIPRMYLQSYLRLLAGHDIVLIGGLEYTTDVNKKAYNSTVISVPVLRSSTPGGGSVKKFVSP
jgi:hypothetical protein